MLSKISHDPSTPTALIQLNGVLGFKSRARVAYYIIIYNTRAIDVK